MIELPPALKSTKCDGSRAPMNHDARKKDQDTWKGSRARLSNKDIHSKAYVESRKGAGEMLAAAVEVLPVLLLYIWPHAVLSHLIQLFPFDASTSSEDGFSSESSG